MHLNRPIALLAGLLMLSPAVARSSDWPGWRGPTRTGTVPEGEPVPAALPQPPKVLWHIPIGYAIASPIVSGPVVIYLDNQHDKEVVHAVDRLTGKEEWTDVLDNVHKDSQSAPGPRCTPVADGQRVYAQSGRGTLHCLSLADGKLLWQANYVRDFGATFIGEKGKATGATRHGYTATPLIDVDRLLVEAGGSPQGAVVCFGKTSGKVIWKSEAADTPAYAAPMLANVDGTPQMIAFMADGLLSLDPTDGKVLWRFPVKTSLGRHAATPIIAGDRIVISSHEAGLMGVSVVHQDSTWSARRDWCAKDLAINFASPVAVGGHLLGVGPSKNLICVDIATGKAAWSKEGFFTGSPGKAYAGMIVLGKNVLTLTDDGQLVLFAASPEAYHEVGRVRACGKNWCIPAYADGKLYLRDEKELSCLQLMP